MARRLKIKKFFMVWYHSIANMLKHDGVEHAGYMSFLIMLAAFPFLFFFIAIVGNLSNLAGIPLVSTLTDIILSSPWANFIDSLRPRIIELSSLPPQSFLTMAILTALWTASSIFEAMRAIFNRAYNVTKPPRYILRRFWSFVEFIIVIVILAAAALFLTVLPPAWKFLENYGVIPENNVFVIFAVKMQFFRGLMVYCFGIVFLSYVYYFLPSRKQKLLRVLPGVLLVLVGWSYFVKIFRYYLYYFSQLNMIYGSITGVVISLLFFYFCSLILIYGAEFNAALEKSYAKQ